ncbi:pyridoxamine 5'-phosphate oxidase family protein [Nonomuraea africana]|uniref:Nitroimidazol reductase NimA-like FMN-containing flavoprotein (Pyridoxamine 5'-phosphate oxidase superfamily) n=1 Tax=Nonomuraea africana TaxID=46171 RepID=A0ABR9KI64_9ACTN|nr:pyridoxamine 5'-phosphate oxidase family protein [Nonomuraea africana]MBE1561343.1 nitroimidazol reductase NimA-like FMN-containing flavoprotein (pyridoxamine 5'-phosphate oxidase superfamily) [Nonomuraea africana]
MALSTADREAFLAEAHIGALAVQDEEGRGPLAVPVWYDYSPGGEVSFLTDRDSRKARLVTKAGRFTMLVERTHPTYRYVSVEGPVSSANPTTVEELTRIAARYLSEEAVESYVARSNFDVLVTFHMRPARWLSSDLGSF